MRLAIPLTECVAVVIEPVNSDVVDVHDDQSTTDTYYNHFIKYVNKKFSYYQPFDSIWTYEMV